MKVPKALSQYFPPKEFSVAVLDDLDRIKVYLESRISICRAQGPIGDTGYFQLVRCSPQHKGKKRLVIVATVENVEKTRRIPAMFFVLAAPGNSLGSGLLCSCILGCAVFFGGSHTFPKAQEIDLAKFESVEDAENSRIEYLASAEQYRSPSLEFLRTLVVVAVDASTDFETLARYWLAHVRTPLPPPIDLCSASSRS
jgi:hypothetical protein